MTEPPTGVWSETVDLTAPLARLAEEAPLAADWRRLPGVVTHVFSHFALDLAVLAAVVPQATPAPAGARWVARRDLDGEAVPSVFRKVVAHAHAHADAGPARSKSASL